MRPGDHNPSHSSSDCRFQNSGMQIIEWPTNGLGTTGRCMWNTLNISGAKRAGKGRPCNLEMHAQQADFHDGVPRARYRGILHGLWDLPREQLNSTLAGFPD